MLRKTIAMAIMAAAGYVAMRPAPVVRADSEDAPNTGMADPATFAHLYGKWSAAQKPGASALDLYLLPVGGLSTESVNASGRVAIDLAGGSFEAVVVGLPAGDWEVWLADNQGTGSALPDAGDRTVKLGQLEAVPDAYALGGKLPAGMPPDFEADRAVVVRAGRNPADGFVMMGGSNVYERIARGYVRNARTEAEIAALIAKGRSLFSKERFNGNGRSCGTCHSEANNFTLDAAFIATLPANDPLFVHERTPELARNFEDASRLRTLGLIVANADGFDNLAAKFTLRPPRSLQSVGTQIAAPDPFFGADFTSAPAGLFNPERLGWSNDALPLRDFAIGAIVQHMPKTLARRPGSDFRLPTDDELDAMAMYQLSVGRQEDFDLKRLKLKMTQAVRGQELYLDTGEIGETGHKNCNACHFNGGGTGAFAFNPGVPGFSPKLDALPRGYNVTNGTNVNGLPRAAELRLPRDGGFGSLPLPFGGFGNFGDIPGVGVIPLEEFKSMSVVESADTAPFMHNHTVATLEDAVAFYGTPAYSADISIGSPTLGPIPVKISGKADDPEVQAISTFLRVLNVLENIRSAVSAGERARKALELADGKELAGLAREEVVDAIQVLSEGSLARSQDLAVLVCRSRLTAARLGMEAARDAANRQALEQALQSALGALRGSRELLADPATLPASFRK